MHNSCQIRAEKASNTVSDARLGVPRHIHTCTVVQYGNQSMGQIYTHHGPGRVRETDDGWRGMAGGDGWRSMARGRVVMAGC